MRNLTAALCLVVALLMGGAGLSWSADFQKGLEAAKTGDYATALREWTPLAEQGDVEAQYNLGQMYAEGQGVPQDYKAAVNWYTLAAEQGAAKAQFNLGFMYRKGQGVPQDYKAAVQWYRLAAEQGFAEAQTNLGTRYALGQGVPQNYVRAHMWFNLSSANGAELGSENRDITAGEMTPVDILIAERLARECMAKDYKGC